MDAAQPLDVAAEEARERSRLATLIAKHKGNISAVGRELGYTRQAITRHLRRYDLMGEADRARFGARVPGPRARLGDASPEMADEKRALLEALRAGGHRGAAQIMGVGQTTIVRRMRRHKLTRADYR